MAIAEITQHTQALSGAVEPLRAARLASKEFTPAMVRGIVDELRKDRPKNHCTVGIVDDVTRTSLADDRTFSIEQPGTVRTLTWPSRSLTALGFSRAQLDQIRAEYAAAPPEPGSVLFHNDKERRTAVQPQIGAGDVRDDGRALRLLLAAGAGIPEHYLAEGGNANRATAAEMGLPAMKRFQRRQEYLRVVISRICARAVENAVKSGRLSPRRSRELAVVFDEVSPTPAHAVAAAAKSYASALAIGQQLGWVTPEEGRELWWRFAGDAPGGAADASLAGRPAHDHAHGRRPTLPCG